VGGRAGPGVGARCLARETTGGLREADGGAEAVREVDGFVVGAGGVRFPAHEVASAVVGGLVRDPVRGPMITELFERRRDGEPLADLARWLAEREGRPCAPTVVSKLLRNPAYVGEAVMHRYERERATGRVVGPRGARAPTGEPSAAHDRDDVPSRAARSWRHAAARDSGP
jgi:hypothetical protein